MNSLVPTQLVEFSAGSRNCGGVLTTFWFTSTCSVAGGLIGLAFGGIGSPLGSLVAGTACQWICHYAC